MGEKFKVDIPDTQVRELEAEGIVWSHTLCCWVDEEGEIGPGELHDLGLCEPEECDYCEILDGWEGQP